MPTGVLGDTILTLGKVESWSLAKQTESTLGILRTSFRLGHEKVKERTNYDHVGVNVSIFAGDKCGISERLSKARRSLNALTGLGIRRCGLTVGTCSILFWSIVVPIALYGCELWFMSGEYSRLLESFQDYASKKRGFTLEFRTRAADIVLDGLV